LWVAVGNTGQIRTSTDGTTWTTQISNFGILNISSVAYGNNLWVAGASNQGAALRTSTDAITWTTSFPGFHEQVRVVAYGNGLWVAVGFSGFLVTSTDAINWIDRRPKNFGTITINYVAYGNDLWVVVGNGGQITSTDGITWTTQSSAFGLFSFDCVAYGNNLWVAGGNSGTLRTSTVINHPPVVTEVSSRYTPWIKT